MGIELPGELADVAAQAGIQWPQADEEAMRSSAQAWRQAGTKITALAKDADGTANQALSAVSGATGVAAGQHWQTFVAPDTGHLTSTAKGCADAADRLDHAADQVGTAKVRIVAHLVNLAKNTDAANQAAAAGHPTALAGLHTVVRGTASSVAQVNHSLTNSIRLDHAVPVPQVTQPVTHAVLGQHGVAAATGPLVAAGPLAPVTHGPGHLVDSAAGTGPIKLPPVTNSGPGHHVDPGPQPVAQPVAQPIGAVLSGHGPLHSGELHSGELHSGELHTGEPTPPMGATVVQSAAPALATPPSGFAPGPAHTDLPSLPPAQQQQAAQPGFTSAPTPAFGTPAPQQPTAMAAPAPVAAPISRAPMAAPAAAPPVQDNRRQDSPAPDNPVGTPDVSRSARQRNPMRDTVALFLVYLFPIGQLPKASSRPVHQLPPPAEETDFAAGLRFEPHDHPESHLMDTTTVGPAPTHPGLADTEPEVVALADGHDPLGGEHERDWDRRFLVRPADDDHRAEYAWPPGELFPEGGCDTGEPEVLAPDTVIDRFGTADGRVFGEDGTPFAKRSLPPDQLAAGYHRYQVTRDLPVWRTLSAAWFGQPGGGVRYRAGYPAADLVAMGYLTELTGTEHGH
jgi:Tuberculosis necrotizing toxin